MWGHLGLLLGFLFVALLRQSLQRLHCLFRETAAQGNQGH
jgi:hypothetical protein